jgi:hypothetical protein
VWRQSAKRKLPPTEWDKIRIAELAKAGGRCRVCLAEDDLDSHERWKYHVSGPIARLVGFTILCRPCHNVVHCGLSLASGLGRDILRHLCRTNHMDWYAAKSLIDWTMRKWKRLDERISFVEISDDLIKTYPQLRKMARSQEVKDQQLSLQF